MSAKITRPALSGAVQRKRIFTCLDSRPGRPISWVSAPGGSGKSTLVASYLDARNLPCIWYQCDEGDSDLATFFYYLGLAAKKAAPRHKTPLPLLTPEYLAGIPTFTRRYFETLCSRLISVSTKGGKAGFTIVLDNYQDIPADAPFHTMLATGLDAIPDGIHFVIISRNEPPAAFARLQAQGRINLLHQNEIRFTLEEATELVQGRIPDLGTEQIQAMHEKTKGWAAGLILMLESGRLGGTNAASTDGFSYDRVFDYFAGELFNKTEQGLQEFLLKSAFLPVLTVALADKLTGTGNAERILSSLHRHHLFTERFAGGGHTYQYHPLFRAFLQNRAESTFFADTLATIRQQSARLLEQAGQTEDAARLYADAGDLEGLGRLVILHARELLMQGRSKTVEEWLAGIPGAMVEQNPWLLYWAGICLFPLAMPHAREYLEKAFELFKSGDDLTGIYLAWAGIVDTYAFGFDEWNQLDGYITIFEELRKNYPSFPSQELDLIASSRMLMSLNLRKTDQPQWVQEWLQRVSALLQENPSFDIQMDTLFCMSVYYLWKGEYEKNAILLETAEAALRHHQPPPFAVIRIKLMKGIHCWITAEYAVAVQSLSEGLELSGKSGVHMFDSLLWGFRAAAEMASGNLAGAAQAIQHQISSLAGRDNTLDIFFYHINSAWYAILRGNLSSAAEYLETVAPKVAKMGTPYYRALWHIGMAQTAFMQERTKDAKNYLQTAYRISLKMKSQVMEWYALLLDAWFLLQEGKQTEGLLSLHRGLSLGRMNGYIHLEFYQPAVMQFLYAKALEEGIEPDYVKGQIRKLGLTPPHFGTSAALYLEEWPYPVKVYTLGRFKIIRDDEPLQMSGKEQKKPLELLKALIACGGREVPVEHLTEALWPDADGDQAHKSFETTLARLRKLLGRDDFINYRAGHITLNPLYCWADCHAFERLSGAIRETCGERTESLCEKTLHLYQGSFLPTDTGLTWAVSFRETLQNKLLRMMLAAGRHFEQADSWEKAAGYYAKGIETDPLAEEFYRRLMLCQLKLGNHADAVKTYHRCCTRLQAGLGIKPSPQTTAVYSCLLQK